MSSTAVPLLRASISCDADLGDGAEVEAETRVRRDQDGDLAGELAREHGALHVAARELSRSARDDGRRSDAEPGDRLLAHGAGTRSAAAQSART